MRVILCKYVIINLGYRRFNDFGALFERKNGEYVLNKERSTGKKNNFSSFEKESDSKLGNVRHARDACKGRARGGRFVTLVMPK